MPVYTNRCKKCEHTFEEYQSITAEALKICPQCKEESLGRVPQIPGIAFIGGGFYCTENPKN